MFSFFEDIFAGMEGLQGIALEGTSLKFPYYSMPHTCSLLCVEVPCGSLRITINLPVITLETYNEPPDTLKITKIKTNQNQNNNIRAPASAEATF